MNPRNHLEKAIKINPDFSEAYFELGLLEKLEGNKNDALKLFKKAVSINKNFAKAECYY